MFFKKSKLAKRTYLALSLTTAMVAAYQPSFAQAESFGSKIVDAVEANSAEQVKMLLDKGINPNERGQFGTSALLRAANNGNLEIAKILISKGANANVSDFGGATALHIAARKGDFVLTEFLLKNKADVNLADKEGNTPLMLAAIAGSDAIVDELIAQGAEIDATNNSGETALLYATDNSAEKIVDALVAAGAKNDVVIEMGRGFRSISSVEKERQAERERGEQLIAKLDERDLVDYSADYPVEVGSKVDFIDYPELAMLDTPNFAQIEPASGKAEQPKSSWLAGLKKSFEDAGAFELASVKNFAEGTKYAILEMGSFKVKAFAEKRVSELQMDNMDVLSDVQLVIFERGTGANIEYVVNGGVFETRAEADEICQKLAARGVRCNSVETAMITNDQFAKFNAPVKSEYSAPAVEKANIDEVKIPEMPKTEAIKAVEAPAQQLKTLAKVEPKIEPKPATPVVDAKPIAANAPTTLAAPVQVKPEIVAVKTDNENLSLLAQAGMADGKDDAKKVAPAIVKTEEKKQVSSIVDKIYAEKEAANVAPVAKAEPEKIENIAEVKKQIEALPALDSQAPATIVMPKLESKTSAAPVVANAKEPMKIVFAEPKVEPKIESKAAEPLKVVAAATQAPSVVGSENLSPKGEKIAEFKIVNNSTVKPQITSSFPVRAASQVVTPVKEMESTPKQEMAPKAIVQKITIPAEAAAPAAVPKVVAETTQAPQPVKASPSAPVDKFLVAKPVRVDDARSVAPAPSLAPQPKVFVEPAYTNAAPVVAYESVYIPPVPTFNRKDNRRMAQVDYFATSSAAQGLYWKYRQAGMLADYTTVRATKGLLRGAHYSALIGEFSSPAEAQAFCNEVYKAEKLRCKVQDELDYTSAPRLSGSAKSYKRHSNYSGRNAALSRHSSR